MQTIKRMVTKRGFYMKHLGALSFIVLGFAILSCTPSKKNENPYANYATYETEEYLIQYPKSWRLDTSGYLDTDFSIFSKQTSLLDKFIENVNMKVITPPDTFTSLSMYMSAIEESKRVQAKDSLLLESEMLQVNSTPLHKLVYTQQQGLYILKFQQYYFLQNAKVYVLTFVSKENEYNTYKERGELMMNSFVLK